MTNYELFPPLRLVLNTECNGKCYFCHHEGCSLSHNEMPKTVIDECIEAASRLKIPKISLTGGEPTLRNDLPIIVSYIKERLPKVELSITTNGKNLHNVLPSIIDQIDKINLSLISFNSSIYCNYQNVNPTDVFKLLRPFAAKTTVNVVVVNDNQNELIEIIDKCIDAGFCVDLMFELISNDILLQKKVLAALTENYGVFSISYSSTPVMILNHVSGRRIRIKSPCISNILTRNICKNCTNYDNCHEKVCGLRVYPNGDVTPCLNSFVQSSQKTIVERIEDLYPQLDVCAYDLYSFFIK